MELGYSLNIEQTQKLAMTPELIQAIRILQFTNAELNEYIENELLENPVLEVEPSEKSDDINLDELRERVLQSEEELETYRQWEATAEKEHFYFEQFVAFRTSLVEHLLGQLQLSDLCGKAAAIGRYLIQCVDDNGYIAADIDEIATRFSAEEDEMQAVLDVLQGFEPCGVCARNLADTLMIQLAAKGELNDRLKFIIENKLDDVAANRVGALSKAMRLKPGEVQEMLDRIKALEPKPGRLYDSDSTVRYITPDVFVEKNEENYIAVSNDDCSPTLILSQYYKNMTEEDTADPEVQNYLNKRLSSAMWLIKSIEQRKSTIQKVAAAIVSYQQDFFRRGELYLRPLTLKQIAEEVGVHESTVSRAISGKFMQSNRGVLELKYFFASGVAGEDGEGISSSSIKSRIKAIIEGEDAGRPLSDLKIAEMLTEGGVEISRRTVAKYRENLGIQSSAKRKRF